MKPKRFGLPVLLVCLVACTVSKKKAEPTVRQPVTKPDIQGEDVSYQAGDTALKGYIAWDANQTAPRPGVIMVHEWWGHNEYVRGRARQLAEAGTPRWRSTCTATGERPSIPTMRGSS